jgi:hypothetical protein
MNLMLSHNNWQNNKESMDNLETQKKMKQEWFKIN